MKNNALWILSRSIGRGEITKIGEVMQTTYDVCEEEGKIRRREILSRSNIFEFLVAKIKLQL